MEYVIVFLVVAFFVWFWWGIVRSIYRKIFRKKLIHKQTLGTLSPAAQPLSSALKQNDEPVFFRLADQASMDDAKDFMYLEDVDNHIEHTNIFSNYANHRPQSSLAQLLYGRHLIKKAWSERGSGTADTVTESGFQGFAKYLEHAEQVLQHSIELDSNLPDTHTQMLVVKMGKNDLMSAKPFFENAKSRFPLDFGIHYQMINSLSEKWSGIEGMVLKFARTHSAEDNTNNLQWLIPAAHLEVGMFESDKSVSKYFKDKAVRQEIKEAFKLYQSIPEPEKNDRDYLNGLQCFAAASFAGLDKKQAKKVFKKMNGQYAPIAWGNWGHGDPREAFILAKWWAT